VIVSKTVARFREVVDSPDEKIDLARAALLIAKNVCQDLDVERYLLRIEQMGRELAAQLPEPCDETERILALNHYMFEEQGFGPNVEDYYDVRNSFLHEVIERRVGIPISLSILYMQLGRSIGLELHGVTFPGHFLVKCKVGEGTVVLDPYGGGIPVSVQDLQRRVRDARGGEVSRASVAGMLVAARKKDILVRMLRNLKAIYLEKRDHDHALSIMGWIILLAPDDAAETRERGLLFQELECFRAALEDLERYLQLAPAAPDADEVRRRVVGLRLAASRLN
jgi:regulator of sirC expression with transglutaminase-like and TPR domain